MARYCCAGVRSTCGHLSFHWRQRQLRWRFFWRSCHEQRGVPQVPGEITARCITITNHANLDLIKFGQVPARDQRGAKDPYQSFLSRHGPFIAQDSQQPPAAWCPLQPPFIIPVFKTANFQHTSVSAVRLLCAGLQCCGFPVPDGVFALQDISAISKCEAILHRRRAHTSV